LDRAIELGRIAGGGERARVTLARMLARADRYEEARALWSALIGDARRRADPALSGYLVFLARMEVASGSWEAATELCEQAIALLEKATAEPDPPHGVNRLELARTQLALGIVQRRAQHKRAARETLRSAADRFEQLGAQSWTLKARAELRRIGGRTASDDEL